MDQLIYIWVHDFPPIRRQGFTLYPKYKVETVYDEVKKELRIQVGRNPEWVDDLFDGWVKSAVALIGENGSGKTRLMELLGATMSGIAPEKFGIDYSWVALFYDFQEKDFYCDYHSEKEDVAVYWSRISNPGVNYPAIHCPRNHGYFNQRNVFDKVNGCLFSIHYSPYMNQWYPITTQPEIHHEIGSNFLLYEDQNVSSSPSDDWLLVHRTQNTKRWLEFQREYVGKGHQIESLYWLTNKVEVQFSSNLEFHKEDVDYDSKELYNAWVESRASDGDVDDGTLGQHPAHLRKTFGSVRHDFAGAVFKDYLRHLDKFYSGFDQDRSKIDRELPKVKLRDIPPFVHSGKRNWVRAVRAILEKQKWFDKAQTKSILDFFELVLEMISLPETEIAEESYHKAHFIVPVEKAFEILKGYETYLSAFTMMYSKRFKDLTDEERKKIKKWRDGFLEFVPVGRPSTGEEAMLNLYSRLRFALTQPTSVLESTFPRSIYILLDEGDAGFHPEWQRRYLNDIVEFLNTAYSNLNFHLILASHSPFLISDLPDYCVHQLKNRSGETIGSREASLAKTHPPKTFAANIHSLFRDYFLESTMGEFAKRRLKKVADRLKILEKQNELKAEESTELDRLEDIIKLVGEDILRERLLELVDSCRKKDDLERRIERKKQELKELEAQLRKRNEKN